MRSMLSPPFLLLLVLLLIFASSGLSVSRGELDNDEGKVKVEELLTSEGEDEGRGPIIDILAQGKLGKSPRTRSSEVREIRWIQKVYCFEFSA